MSLTEIEAAISDLSAEDFNRLRDWFLDRQNALWDKQIADDSAAGRHGSLVKEIEGEIANGNVKPLDEIIHGS